MSNGPKRGAPLSPFLGIYRWRYTFLNPSILHRASGVLLSLGLLVLTYFLMAVASGAQSYSRAHATLASPWFYMFYVAWTWSFFYHLLAGTRHLMLDTGHGLERRSAHLTATAVVTASLLLTLPCCWLLARRFGFL